MKTKNIFIILICLFAACPAYAFKEQTENWLQKESEEIYASDRPGLGGGDEPGSGDPDVNGSVGDVSWVLALGLSFGYGVYVFGRNKKSKET